MSQNLKRISHALVKNNGLKKTALVAVLFLLVAAGLTFLVQPAKAASITILSHSGYNSYEGYIVVGEVQNVDTVPVGWVEIKATFYDNSNNVIAVEETYAGLDIILPNLKSPFHIWLLDETQASRVDHYTLEVKSSQRTSTLPLDLKILSSSDYLDVAEWMHIVGEVENQATINATSPSVWATCYGSDGKVVDAFFDYPLGPDEMLLPGQKSSFDILIWSGRVPLVESYVLAVTSYLTLTPAPTPTPTSTPTSSPTSPTSTPTLSPTYFTSTPTITPTTKPTATPTPSPSPTASPPTSPSSTPSAQGPSLPTEVIYAIIIAIIIAIVAVVAVILKKRQSRIGKAPLPPPPPPPPPF